MWLESGAKIPASIDMLGDRREWLLERLDQYEDELAEQVREAYANGESATRLAKRAKVSRPTIYKWVKTH